MATNADAGAGILIDSRELDPRKSHGPDLLALIRSHLLPPSLADHAMLPNGDVLICGNGPGGRVVRIGFEIKRISDALACMRNGRLGGVDGQLEGMFRDYDLVYLIIEDDLARDPSSGLLLRVIGADTDKPTRDVARPPVRRQTGMQGIGTRRRGGTRTMPRFVPVLHGPRKQVKYSEFHAWMTSLVIGSIELYRRPLLTAYTADRAETAAWLVTQYHYWNSKRFDQHKSMRMFNVAGLESGEGEYRRRNGVGFASEGRRRRARLAQAYDGVGYERAMNLAGHFASDHAMFDATPDELAVEASRERGGRRRADGISKRLARVMWEKMREESK